jgi:hypothetical protein
MGLGGRCCVTSSCSGVLRGLRLSDTVALATRHTARWIFSYLLKDDVCTTPFVPSKRMHRLSHMRLSSHTTAVGCHSTALRCLDLDPAEGRYLLSGSSDASLQAWDAWVRG